MQVGCDDVQESVASNTVKEVREEAGLNVKPVRLIALHDYNLHNPPISANGIMKAFVLCRVIGGAFAPNSETTESGYFSLDELPPLAENKTTREQIKMCFDAHRDENWRVPFD